MSDHETYREINKERRNQKTRPLNPAWEAARERFAKTKEIKPAITCVCSHSKYHHTITKDVATGRDYWGKCGKQEECGCDGYQTWKDKPL